MNNMNRDFINRNRVFWMNTHGVAETKVIVNDDLFNVPADVSCKDEISVNIKHSNKPLAVGVMSYKTDDDREYLAYGNDYLGKILWVQEFNTFNEALSYAKKAYINDINEMYYDYMYEETHKISKK